MEQNYWTDMFGRRLSRRRALQTAGLAGAGAAALGVVGCGDDDDDDGGGGAKSSGSATASGDVKTGGAYKATVVIPTGLDVMKNTGGAPQAYVGGFCLSRLLKYETGPSASFARDRWYTPVPDLAEKWENPDPQTFVFTIRPNAKFHNIEPTNGRAVRADDVVFSYEYYKSARPDKGALFTNVVDSVQAVGPDKLQFKLKQPFAPFLGIVARDQDLWIYPPELIQADGDASKRVVGSGPWIFESLQRDLGAKYRKNPDYWMKDDKGRSLPYLDRWDGADIPDTNTQLTQFQAKNINQVTVPAALLDQFKSQNPNAQIETNVTNLLTFLFFPPGTYDENLKPFNDVRVRRAVSMAIDRDAIIGLASNNKGGTWNNILNAGSQWYLDPRSKEMGQAGEHYKYNPEKAKALLKEAGYDELNIELYFNRNGYVAPFPWYNPVAEALPAMLKKVNINATLKGMDYLSQWINPQSGIFFGKLPPNSIAWAVNIIGGDPDGYLYGMLHPQGAWNNPGHSRVRIPELTTLVEDERKELNIEKRKALVYDIQRKVSDQMVFVPMTGLQAYTGYQPFVKNIYSGGTSYGFGTENYIHLWLDQ